MATKTAIEPHLNAFIDVAHSADMPSAADWSQVALRLLLALLAGALLGIDRTSRGRPAGMRTTMMVCVAGAVAMILAEQLSHAAYPERVSTDTNHLAQGVLAGMGFIGAGAIIRRDNAVLGVTTAATLWFATIVGLCFGAGSWRVGLTALAFGLVILLPLYLVEERVPREHTGSLSATIVRGGMSDDDLRQRIHQTGKVTSSWSIQIDHGAAERTITCRVTWNGPASEDRLPDFVAELERDPQVARLKWEPVLS